VIITELSLTRTFVSRIGFTQAVRDAAKVPADPELLRIFRKIAPKVDWDQAQASTRQYEPPRWLGYWSSAGKCWASDGVLKLMVRRAEPLQEVYDSLSKLHYRGSTALPFVSTSAADPTHMLLHDSELWRLYIASFEQGEATLVKQARVPW
jgi:hypothetical protein